jgi:Glycosyl hydrolases family 38 C-terminal domain
VKNGNQMTLMTTRAHGGSSIKEGQIEIMHHRRMYCDDGRGVGEPLNETDEFGNGMRVTTTYYLQLFNNL